MATYTLPPYPVGAEPGSYVLEDWYMKLRDNMRELGTESIVLTDTAHIRGGQTSWNVGAGFFLGYETDAYRFSIGNGTTKYMTWDGSNLNINGTLADGIVTTNAILDDTINHLKLMDDAVRQNHIFAGSVTADKMYVSELGAISANLGTVNAGIINGVTITGGTFRTAPSGQRLEMDSTGITLSQGAAASPYGTAAATYNMSSNKYGSGVLAYINNATKRVPFYVNSEQTVGDIHYFNRSADPTGAAEVGDTAVVGGKLKICTVAGTPGTWTVVGTQT